MKSDAVLMLGTEASRSLSDALFEAGYTPVIRSSVQGLLDKLRRGGFAAVLVDGRHSSEDVLELFLNVRDIDQAVPVVIVGPVGDSRSEQALLSMPGVFVLSEFKDPSQIGEALEKTGPGKGTPVERDVE